MANRNNNITVLAFMQDQINQLQRSNRFGTALNYEKTLHRFEQFLNGKDIPFKKITETLIIDFNTFLQQRGLVRNSTSFYIRILRAVYNKAVKLKIIKQTNPFAEVYTGIDRTRKRALHQTLISAINNLPLPPESRIALSRDLFIFSYCTRGMSFIDVAYLKKSNIQNGYISYSRRKTGQLLTIRIETPIEEIIKRYNTVDSPYIFPLITSIDPEMAYIQYQQAINAYNRDLKYISNMLPGKVKITSYVSRHTWATTARNLNIPISVISAGMGHTTEQTTRIYLDSIENSSIDDANREIVGKIM